MRIVLLGSVNPSDFELDSELVSNVPQVNYVRSIPVVDLAEGLVSNCNQIYVISLARGISERLEIQTDSGVTLIFVPSRHSEKLKAVTFYTLERKRIINEIKRISPDIVHAHWTYEYALAAKDSGISYLVTVHDAPLEIFKDFRNFFFLMRLIIAIRVRFFASGRFVYVSDYLRKKWNNQMFGKSGEVIPNMFNMEVLGKSEKNSGINIISVGNANRGKNIDFLLKAWEIVYGIDSSLTLHLVGDGLGPSDPLFRKFSRGTLGNTIFWHGKLSRAELKNLYSKCQIMVHPSKHESFGLIFLEAFANELSIIALESSGGALEVVGKAGILLKDNSCNELAKAILEMSANQSRREEFVREGKDRLMSFSKNVVTEKYLSLYDEILLK